MSTNFRYNLVKTIKPYVKYFPQLTPPVLKTLIILAKYYLENTTRNNKNNSSQIEELLKKLSHENEKIPDNFCELFAAILQIMQIFLRTSKGVVKDYELKECLKDLRMSDECSNDLIKVLYNHHSSLCKSLATNVTRSTARNLQWRINISLSEGIIHSKLPTIILHFQLPDGKYRTLELPFSMFHRLRHNVALLLSELHSLENRAVMKKF